MSANYSAHEIEVLEGLDPVRKRPAMYIGGVDSRGLHHLVWEILDNSIDEYLNGHGTRIDVALHPDHRGIEIGDNGRGIPVDLHPKHKKSGLELVLTVLHAGGKFSDKNYAVAGGLHGVGASVVNALSRELVATIRRDGHEHRMEFRRGKPAGPIKKVGPARGHGTTISFKPDETIFPRCQFVPDTIRQHLEDVSYLHRGLKIGYADPAKKESVEFHNPEGIAAYLRKLVKEGQKTAVVEGQFDLFREQPDRVEASLTWTESTEEQIRSYVNGIRTASGGSHESGFKSAIAKAVRNYLDTHSLAVKGVTIEPQDIREGIVGVLSIFIKEPQFQGQTKEKLNNPEVQPMVENAVRAALEN